jgi:hypothetical protein
VNANAKPRVSPLVPTRALDRWLGATHVGTPDTEIAATLEAQLAKNAARDTRWTPAIRRQTIRYALWRHHRNLAEYADVMRGR